MPDTAPLPAGFDEVPDRGSSPSDATVPVPSPFHGPARPDVDKLQQETVEQAVERIAKESFGK